MQRENIKPLSRHAGASRVALLGAAVAISSLSCKSKVESDALAASAPPAPPVSIAEVVSAPVTEAGEYTGRSEAVDYVEVRPRVSGELRRAAFREGDLVKKGDLLFVIDPRPYEAALAKAQGALARSRADVAFAQRDAARATELIKNGSISGRDWDTQTSALQQFTAAEQVATADVTAAGLDVEYSTIRAPVAGRIGRLMVTPGNLVAPTTASPLTTLVSVDPLYVYVDVDEARALRLPRPHTAGQPDLVAHVGFAGEDDYPHEASLDFIDNRSDPATGTTKLRLVLKNPDGKLSPGLFARVDLPEEGAAHPALLVSDRAVGTDQDRRFVMVVDKDNKVQYRGVKLGPLHQGLRVVRDGLAPSERVVVRGLQRVRPGVVVAPELVTMESVDHPDTTAGGSMKIARFFVDRPIFAAVLSIVIFVVGAIAAFQLPISEYPEVVPPTVVVRAQYPGASPKVIAETVAAPLEQEINGAENMLYMQSQSNSDGTLSLTVTFRIGTDLDQAQVQVQNRVSQALPRLPDDVRRFGVTTRKSSPDLTMVVHIVSPDGRYDEKYLRNFALLQVKDTLARIPGMGDVQLFGSGDYSMRVWLDPRKLAGLDLTAGDVIRALREQNVQVAAGTLGQQPAPSDANFQLNINAHGRLVDEAEFGDVVLRAGPSGAVVRLRDVARIELGANDYALRSLLNNKAAVAIPIFQSPGSNALELSDNVRKAMTELSRGFPEGITYSIVYDPTRFVRASIIEVVHTLVEALVLVTLVVLLFLQTWRASIIPIVAVPVSLVGTFGVMKALGFSINALSLFGLVLAIGIVVDDAIVVVEDVERNIALGYAPREAAHRAMGEVSGPIIAIALVLCAVFVPIAFIPGLTGQFYRQFALTIAISTVISAFNSLTLSPALAAILLRPHDARPDLPTRAMNRLFGWFFRPFNRFFDAASRGYVNTVRRVLRFSAVAIAVYFGLLALTWTGFQKVPGGFVPTQDKQYLVAFAQLPDAASLERSDAVIRRMSQIALDTPGVENAIAFPGLSIAGLSNSPNAGIVFVGLKPFEERTTPDLYGPALAKTLNGKFASIQDAFVAIFPPPPVQGLGTIGGFKLYLEDRGDMGLGPLHEETEKFLDAARKAPELAGMFTGFQVNVPQLDADLDRTKAKTLGVPLTDIFETMQANMGSLYVNDFNRFGRTFQVTVQADAPYRMTPADMLSLKTRNEHGDMVPLASVLSVRETSGPDRVTRYNGYPAAEIDGAPAPGFSSGQALAAIDAIAARTLPSGMKYEWTELTYQQILAGNSAIFVFPLCVLLVFLVLAAQYESWALPLSVILIVPMCLLAAIAGVWIDGSDNNVFTQIGLFVLVGLSCKNAILLVEFAKDHQEHEKSDPITAVLEACRLRLRPILMTSIAFIMGVWPLVVSKGAGAEMRHAMGVAVFSGMIGVTFFGLLLTPVWFATIRRLTVKKREVVEERPAPLHTAASI